MLKSPVIEIKVADKMSVKIPKLFAYPFYSNSLTLIDDALMPTKNLKLGILDPKL